MGTNYYLATLNEEYDAKCPIKRKTEARYNMTHLGKSSGGWTFALHVYPERSIYTLDCWVREMQEYDSKDSLLIFDEYYQTHTLQEFLNVVRDRHSDETWDEMEKRIKESKFYNDYTNLDSFLARNHAVRGPNFLLRRKLDDYHCISYGEGTWDHVIGEFC
jgi:hypothetical protein